MGMCAKFRHIKRGCPITWHANPLFSPGCMHHVHCYKIW